MLLNSSVVALALPPCKINNLELIHDLSTGAANNGHQVMIAFESDSDKHAYQQRFVSRYSRQLKLVTCDSPQFSAFSCYDYVFLYSTKQHLIDQITAALEGYGSVSTPLVFHLAPHTT